MIPAIVTWGDAYDDAGEKDLGGWKHAHVITKTCGFIFKEDDAGVSMCAEISDLNKDEVRHPCFIPRGMILSIVYLTPEMVAKPEAAC